MFNSNDGSILHRFNILDFEKYCDLLGQRLSKVIETGNHSIAIASYSRLTRFETFAFKKYSDLQTRATESLKVTENNVTIR